MAMAVTLFGIANCGTVRKARAWLDERGVAHQFHDYKKVGIDRASIDRWADLLGWEALLNRAGTTFRGLPDADKSGIDRDRAVALMLAHPSLIKRPVVEGEGVLLIGFKPDAFAAVLD